MIKEDGLYAIAMEKIGLIDARANGSASKSDHQISLKLSFSNPFRSIVVGEDMTTSGIMK
jgi:hypothetical protein